MRSIDGEPIQRSAEEINSNRRNGWDKICCVNFSPERSIAIEREIRVGLWRILRDQGWLNRKFILARVGRMETFHWSGLMKSNGILY